MINFRLQHLRSGMSRKSTENFDYNSADRSELYEFQQKYYKEQHLFKLKELLTANDNQRLQNLKLGDFLSRKTNNTVQECEIHFKYLTRKHEDLRLQNQ